MSAKNVGFQHLCLVQSEQRTKESWWGAKKKDIKICIPPVLSGGKILARTSNGTYTELGTQCVLPQTNGIL